MTTDDTPRSRAGDGRGHTRTGPVVASRVPLSILSAPFEFTMAVCSIVIAAGVLVLALGGGVASLPVWLVALWTTMFVCGGSLTLVGMLMSDRPHMLARSRPFETIGMILMSTCWLVYAAGVAFGSGLLGPIVFGPALAVGCALRLVAMHVAKRIAAASAAVYAETR